MENLGKPGPRVAVGMETGGCIPDMPGVGGRILEICCCMGCRQQRQENPGEPWVLSTTVLLPGGQVPMEGQAVGEHRRA